MSDDEDMDRPVLSDEEAGEVAGSGHGPSSAWAATGSGAGTAVASNCQRCVSCSFDSGAGGCTFNGPPGSMDPPP